MRSRMRRGAAVQAKGSAFQKDEGGLLANSFGESPDISIETKPGRSEGSSAAKHAFPRRKSTGSNRMPGTDPLDAGRDGVASNALHNHSTPASKFQTPVSKSIREAEKLEPSQSTSSIQTRNDLKRRYVAINEDFPEGASGSSKKQKTLHNSTSKKHNIEPEKPSQFRDDSSSKPTPLSEPNESHTPGRKARRRARKSKSSKFRRTLSIASPQLPVTSSSKMILSEAPVLSNQIRTTKDDEDPPSRVSPDHPFRASALSRTHASPQQQSLPHPQARQSLSLAPVEDQLSPNVNSQDYDSSAVRLPRRGGTHDKAAKRKRVSSKAVNDPSSRTYLKKCGRCSESFKTLKLLAQHQLEQGHGDGTGDIGVKGQFTRDEIRRVNTWRDQFCDKYSITHLQFGDMMADSTQKRAKGSSWDYKFITQRNFLKQYYDLLPDRNRRSMHRFKERYFMTSDTKKEWTEEDDEDLLFLVEDLGPKWVEIARVTGRTPDSVNQRWRKKLNKGRDRMEGHWTQEETALFMKAIAKLQKNGQLLMDLSSGAHIPWKEVSKEIDGVRTAQQCSNHWRCMQRNRWLMKRYESRDFSDGRSEDGTSSDSSTPTSSVHSPKSNSKQRDQAATMNDQESISQRAREMTTENSPIDQDQDVEGDVVEETSQDESRDQINGQETNSPEVSRLSEGQKDNNNISSSYQNPDDSTDSDGSYGSIHHDPKPSSPSSSKRSSPAAPRNPSIQTTPGNVMGLSQAFEQTQANSSVKRSTRRPSVTSDLQSQVPDRPSPTIALRLRTIDEEQRLIEDEAEEDEDEGDEEYEERNDEDDDDEDYKGYVKEKDIDADEDVGNASDTSSFVDSYPSSPSSTSSGRHSASKGGRGVSDNSQDSMVDATRKDFAAHVQAKTQQQRRRSSEDLASARRQTETSTARGKQKTGLE